ncbi:Biotin synthase [Chitinispirillum alkaliphilum]|nr:Biotin synthase [Chitinispirillum alkaliphilum]
MELFKISQQMYERSIENTIDISDLKLIAEWPEDKVMLLFAASDLVRRHFHKENVDPCTLLNIKSGGCSEDCAFCSQSQHNDTNIHVQDLVSPSLIAEKCEDSLQKGFPFCVVSSGRALEKKEITQICQALSSCKGEKHASLGILNQEEFRMLKEAGVVCYNHNLETSRTFFPSIVTTHSYDDRINTVKGAKNAGLSVCCGGIFGMGETWNDRIEFCNQLKDLDVDTVPINFINAVPGTRISPPKESPIEFLKIVAMFRLAMPQKNIKVCGGREVNLGTLQSLMFFAGANGYVSGGYLTTPGAGIDNDNQMIKSLGLVKRLDPKEV